VQFSYWLCRKGGVKNFTETKGEVEKKSINPRKQTTAQGKPLHKNKAKTVTGKEEKILKNILK